MRRMIADRKFLLVLPFLVFGQIFVDAQVSNNMTLRSNWDPVDVPGNYNDIWGYVDPHGNEYAIIGSSQNIHIIDVTDPDNVVEVSRIPGGQSTIWRDFKTYGERIYAVSDNTSEGLIIIDASDLPNSASVTFQSTEFFTQCHNIYIDEDDGWIYVAGSNAQRNGLIVLDVSENPDQPVQIFSQELSGGYVHDLYVKDRIVYGSHGFNGLYIWDFSDLSDTKLLANTPTNGYNHSSWLTTNCRYVVYAEEVPFGIDLGVVDVTDMRTGDIEIKHTFKFPLLAPNHTNVTPHNPYIIDTTLVVSYYEDGTQVFTLGDPENPRPLAYYDTFNNSSYNGTDGNWGTYPYLPSGNIISSDVRTGLYVLSIDDYDLSSVDYDPTMESVSITSTSSADCTSATTQLAANTTLQSLQWIKDGVMLEDAANATLDISESGRYQLIGYQGQCPVISEEIIIPSVRVVNDQIEASPSGLNYQWTVHGAIEESLSGSSITPTSSGYYSAIYSDDIGCFRSLDSVYYFARSNYKIQELNGFEVFISNNQIIALTDIDTTEDLEVILMDIIGRELSKTYISGTGFQRTEFSTSGLASGMYLVGIRKGGLIETKKVVGLN